MKNLKNLGYTLSKTEQKEIFGGKLAPVEGNCAFLCNSGVRIPEAPDCSESNGVWACRNQNGYSGTCLCADGYPI